MNTLHGVPGTIGAHILRGIIILLGTGKGGGAVIPGGDFGLFNGKGTGKHHQHFIRLPGPFFHFKKTE